MEQVYVKNRKEWREWLLKNHSKEGKMTEHGLKKINAAKESGLWDKDDRPQIDFDIPPRLEKALRKNKKAREFFESLAPSYKKQFIGWIKVAKKEETKEKRLRETIEKLEKGEKLGLK
jgi:uncharacterized protein YdeI (YjbR/CyaY-like superfamily)